MAAISLRPARFDDLGLRRALSDRMLPGLVAAMTFLGVLALTGWAGASALAQHWQQGASSTLTVQIPRPNTEQGNETRVTQVTRLLRQSPAVADVHVLSKDELLALLRPWLGTDADDLAVPLPAVLAVRLQDATADLGPLTRALRAVAPDIQVENQGIWITRLARLAWSLQACAGVALLLVAGIAAAVVAIATQAGLAARREAISIVHGLGATDTYIAGRFAARITLLAGAGACIGIVAAVPVVVGLASLAAPIAGGDSTAESATAVVSAMPWGLWFALPALPVAAIAIGFSTAQATVRLWLRRLP